MSNADQNPGFDEYSEEKPGKGKKRRSGLLLLLLAVILVIAGAGFFVWPMWSHDSPPNAQRDMRGNIVVPDEDAVIEDPDAVADTGFRFVVPTVDLDVPLGEAKQIAGRIAPPGFTSVYWITNLGVSLDNAEDGTFYTATHSLRNGGWAPGNALINIEAQGAALEPGDKLLVSNRTYSVTETRIVPKLEVDGEGDLWDETVPERLLVFTCLQNRQNTYSENNLVIIAYLDEPESEPTTSAAPAAP